MWTELEPKVTDRENIARSLQSPTKAGRFCLRQLLGEGAHGEVYLADDPVMDRRVALKMPRLADDDPRHRGRFLREARAAAQLRHPNLVAVYESGEADGRLYIASEYVEGRVLSELVAEARKTNKPTLAASATNWVRQLAGALAYAHSQQIVHRDVKPDNILIDQRGQSLLMDFGLAKVLGDQSTLTTEGSLLGSPAYMSPEQARGDNQLVGPASDQYSLGVVLYELLTGRPPVEGPAHEVILRILKEHPVPPRERNSRVSRDLEVICLKCLEKEAAHRYESCRELADDLDAHVAGRPISARKTPLWERGVRWTRNNQLIAGLAAGAAVLLVAMTIASASFGLRLARDRKEIDDHLAVAREAQEREEQQARIQSDKEGEAETHFQQAREKKETATRLEKDAADIRAKLEAEQLLIARVTADLKTETEALEAFRKDRAAKLAELDSMEPWSRYVELIKMARAAIDQRIYSEARNLLARCLEEHRGWEWKYLLGQTKGRMATGTRIATGSLVPSSGRVLSGSIAFSHDLSALAVFSPPSDLDPRMKIVATTWHDDNIATTTIALQGSFSTKLSAKGNVRAVAFSPNLEQVAALSTEVLSIWDCRNGRRQSLQAPRGSTTAAEMAFTADRRLIAITGAWLSAQKPAAWDGVTGKTLFEIDAEPLAIDIRARWLACRKRAETGPKSLIIVSLETGKPRESGWESLQKPGVSLSVEECRVSSNGRWLLWSAIDQNKSSSSLVGLTDIQSGKAVRLNVSSLPVDVSVSGQRYLTDRGIHDLKHGDLLLPGPGISAIWSPDEQRIAIVGAEGGLRVLYAPDNPEALPDKPDGASPPDFADSAAVTPPAPRGEALQSRERRAKDVSPNAPAPPIAAVETVAAANLLKPTNRANSWRYEIFEAAKGTMAAVEESIVFNVDAVTGTDWHVQAFQTDFRLKDGDQYTVRFSAKASEPRKVLLGAHIDEADWHPVGLSTPIPLTTAFQTFQVPFRVQNAGEKKCRIGFVLGASAGVVTVKNMTLTENPDAKTPSLDRPQTDAARGRKPGGSAAPMADKPGEVKNSIGMRLALIPAGKFRMGSPPTEKGRAASEAQVDVALTKAFHIGRTEVTQREWQTVMGTTPWQGQIAMGIGPDCPAVFVTWDDAVAFCQKLSEMEKIRYRLPTSAEWEYACRAGTTTAYWFGDDENRLVDFAWCARNTHAVGSGFVREVAHKPANPFGLFDVHGNVWEWCADIHTERIPGGRDPIILDGGSNRTIRGGGCSFEQHCRAAWRNGRPPRDLARDQGFRVVREVAAAPAAPSGASAAGGPATGNKSSD
jgi:formylglycine-generating enzyme required for sulfatase activity/tRNA A-37 threonylcarbamoyl transferase component Bud32